MRQKNKRWEILNKAFINTLITVALIEFSEVGSGFIDGVMTSRFLGSDAMACVGIGRPIFSIVGILSGILALSMQSAGAKEIGKGNFKAFNELSSMTFLLGALVSLLVTAVIVAFSGPITVMLGAKGNSAELFEPTRAYILGLCLGIPAMVLSPIVAPIIQLDNGGNLVRAGSLSGAAADIVLDWLAVKLGMGIFGMGVATAISAYITLLVMLLHFTKKERMLHLRLRKSALRPVVNMLPKGAILAVKRLANVIRPIFINNFTVIVGGTMGMTAVSVFDNVSKFVGIVGAGIVGSVPLVMGIVYGEKSIEDIIHVGKLVHRSTFIGAGAVSLLLVLLASPIATVFVDAGTETHKMVVFSMYMLALELITEALVGARISYLNVISKHLESQLLQLCFKLIIIVPTVFILGKLFGMYGILASFAVSNVVVLAIVYIVTAIRKKSMKILPEDYLRLDESFDADPGNVIELDIRDMDDATLVSEQVQMFCKGHKFDKNKSYFSSLALEEAARLIFENNDFSPDLRIDIRVVIQNGELVLRIRDNGKSSIPFGELSADDESDDAFANIGVKLLRKTAKDIKYYHTLKINYTIITV